MATKKTMNTFEKLNKVDVSQFTEKKGQFNYLSWAHAVRELLKICPTATWEVHLFDGPEGTKQPYIKTGTGAYVQVSVDVDGVIRSQIHPVLDNRNQTIDNPNAFQVNTSIQRCLAKAIALHGLGLYIFAGEDLPEADPLTSAQAYELNELAQGIKNQDLLKEITDSINNNKVNSGNYEKVKTYIGTIITKQEEKKNG